MVTLLDNLAHAVVQKNETIEKLIETNSQQQETIHKLQAQNGELLSLLKHWGGASIADAILKKAGQSSAIWDPAGYCWTYGFKVKKGHNSKSCKTHGEGHQENAPQNNTMGGSKTNKHWVAT
ncbi:hypothetical protein ACHAW6_004538 [Cyclotella cf. meneghiniana]